MGAGAIFNGSFIKLLKDQLKLGTTARILTGTQDPTDTATEAEAGSLFMRVVSGNPALYIKEDNGSTSNWTRVDANSTIEVSHIDDGFLYLSGGELLLPDGRIVVTYDGSGTALSDIGGPMVMPLNYPISGLWSVVFPTVRHIYIDITTLTTTLTVTESGVVVYPLSPANIVGLTTHPTQTEGSRYVYLGAAKGSSPGGWEPTQHSGAPERVSLPVVASSPLAYSMAPTLVGNVGDVGQIAAGHVLSVESFPDAIQADTTLSWWHLAADTSDSGLAPETLLPISGSFAETDPWGNTDSAADSGYKYRNSTRFSVASSFSVGCWFKKPLAGWSAVTGVWGFGMVGGVADIPWEVVVNAGNFEFYTNTSTLVATVAIDPDRAWYHQAVTYDAATSQLAWYVNGVAVFSGYNPTFGAPAVDRMTIGAAPSTVGSQTIFPALSNAFRTPTALAPKEVKKIYATKIAHGSFVPPADQEWLGDAAESLGVNDQRAPLAPGWVIDKGDVGSLYAIFDQWAASDEFVSLRMQDVGLSSSLVVSPRTYDSGWLSAVPAFPFNHNLPELPPEVIILQRTTGNVITQLVTGDFLQWNDTQFTGSAAALGLLGLGASKQIRIIATAQARAAAVGVADRTQSGILTSTTQTLGGQKTLDGSFLPYTDNTRDLGTALLRWRKLYAADAALGALSVGGVAVQGIKEYTADTAYTNGTPTLTVTIQDTGVVVPSGYVASTREKILIPYQRQDGVWMLKFRILLRVDTAGVNHNEVVLSLSGITSRAYPQTVTGVGSDSLTPPPVLMHWPMSSSTITLSIGNGTLAREISLIGEIALTAKPTWAD